LASAVGGDYFDIKLLDEDNLCIIIGDVSGHGAASALIMAIAKAVLYHGFKQTRDLITLFSYLNSVINTYFNKPPVKKMITLFATIINLSSGKSVFLDCGHNFPMKISKDGQITELKMTGFPVGSQKKIRKKNTEEYILEKGETIVFYTDGIIESTGKTIEQYGYDRFKDSLLKLAKEDSDTIIKTLFDNYDKWEDGTEPDDDVTLIVLKRIASQNDK
jgi:sigma-B regulation protein RsbU (phosphoserine phosphatase)